MERLGKPVDTRHHRVAVHRYQLAEQVDVQERHVAADYEHPPVLCGGNRRVDPAERRRARKAVQLAPVARDREQVVVRDYENVVRNERQLRDGVLNERSAVAEAQQRLREAEPGA